MTMKRFALFRGKRGQLVGHPDARHNNPAYFCQMRKPMPEDAMKGFGTVGYSGPELADCYEPTMVVFEVDSRNQKHLEKAVRAGHLDRSDIMMYPSLAAAEKERPKLEASLVERKKAAIEARRNTELQRRAATTADDGAVRAAHAAAKAAAEKMAELERLDAELEGAAPEAPPARPAPAPRPTQPVMTEEG